MNKRIGCAQGDRLIRPREAAQRVGLATSTVRSKRDPRSTSYDPTFPLPIRIGRRATAYRLSEIDIWLEGRRVKQSGDKIDGLGDAA